MARPAAGWPATMPMRFRFERGVRSIFPDLRGRPLPRWGFRYTLTVPVPFYGRRRLTIVFPSYSSVPFVFADGPTDSPHRYDDTGSLCLWYPKDPASRRWVFGDGLLDLVDLAVAHLFREGWWRETKDWLGDEVRHRPAEAADSLVQAEVAA